MGTCSFANSYPRSLCKLHVNKFIISSSFLIRFVVTRLEDSQNLCIVEIKISAGPIGEIFMNSHEQVTHL